MGLPYSKQIHAAFDQVTPLVAAGFEVLQTTKNIAILLACIQVVTVITLILILIALLGLLFTMNPDLETERQQFVTPVMKWLAGWVYHYGLVAGYVVRVLFVLSVIGFGYFLWRGSVAGADVPTSDEEGDEDATDEAVDDAKKKTNKEGEKDAKEK